MYTPRKVHEAKLHARRGVKPLVATVIVALAALAPAANAYASGWARR